MARPAIVTAAPMALPEHELLARVFRTLGDPTRLRMVELLLEALEAGDGDLTQSALVAQVGVSQSRASEHLGCLVWCGFVAAERSGRTVRYRLVDDRAGQFVRLAREFLAGNEAAVGCCTVLDREQPA